MQHIRRWSVLGALGVLLAGGLQPAPAHAAVEAAYLRAWDAVSIPGECANNLSGREPGDVRVPPDGRWRTVTLRRSGRVSSSDVTGGATVTGRVSTDTRGTTRVGMKVSASASARPAWSSFCSIDRYLVSASSDAVRAVTPTKAWLVIQSTGSVRGTTDATFGAEGPTRDYFIRLGQSLTRLVPAGTYTLGGGVAASVSVAARSTTAASSAANATANVAVIRIGTLRTFAGTGRAYVRTGHRDCALNRARIDLTAATRKYARRITFSVNGVRRVTMRSAGLQRSSFYLGRIPDATAGAIRADIVLKSGARRTMQATTWPCA